MPISLEVISMAILSDADGVTINFDFGHLITIPMDQITLVFQPFQPVSKGDDKNGVSVKEILEGAFLCRHYSERIKTESWQGNDEEWCQEDTLVKEEDYFLVVTRPDLCKVGLDQFSAKLRNEFVLAAHVRRYTGMNITEVDKISYVSDLSKIPLPHARPAYGGVFEPKGLEVRLKEGHFAWVNYHYSNHRGEHHSEVEVFAHTDYNK